MASSTEENYAIEECCINAVHYAFNVMSHGGGDLIIKKKSIIIDACSDAIIKLGKKRDGGGPGGQ